MKNLLIKVIEKIRGDNFEMDKDIPLSYLLWEVFIKRLIMLIRGFIIFKKIKHILFIDADCKFSCRKRFFFRGSITIANNCFIDALSKDGIVFGNNISIGKNTTIECSGSLKFLGKGLVVGNNVGLGTHGFFGCAGGVEIGDDTIFGNFVSLHSENHNYSDSNTLIRLQGVNRKGIKIGNNCWIGAKATILDGAIIEDGCIIAAGSLVTEGIYLANIIYGGVPAKFIKKRF